MRNLPKQYSWKTTELTKTGLLFRIIQRHFWISLADVTFISESASVLMKKKTHGTVSAFNLKTFTSLIFIAFSLHPFII